MLFACTIRPGRQWLALGCALVCLGTTGCVCCGPEFDCAGLESCPRCHFPRILCGCGESCPGGCDAVVGEIAAAKSTSGKCPPGCRCEKCCKNQLRIAVGPPAKRLYPEMPPEFLPVPVQPITAAVNMQPVPEVRGVAEVGPGPQIAFPAGE